MNEEKQESRLKSVEEVFKKNFIVACMAHDKCTEQEAIESFSTDIRDDNQIKKIVYDSMEEYANQFKGTTPAVQDTGKWISVEDELPKMQILNEFIETGEDVQIFDSIHGINQAWIKRYLTDSTDSLTPERIKGYWMFENARESFYNVTHWQPLPAPPSLTQDTHNIVKH